MQLVNHNFIFITSWSSFHCRWRPITVSLRLSADYYILHAMNECRTFSELSQGLQTNTGMCWPAVDKHLGAAPKQFKKGLFGASIIWRFLWVARAWCQERGDAFNGKLSTYWRFHKSKVLKPLIHSPWWNSLFIKYITWAVFTYIKIVCIQTQLIRKP